MPPLSQTLPKRKGPRNSQESVDFPMLRPLWPLDGLIDGAGVDACCGHDGGP